MITIKNTQECFVQLWLQLERTRRLLAGQYKRFCIRHILKSWFGTQANVCGYDALPPPSLCPRVHRELLRAIVSVCLDIGMRKVNLKALDKAYSIAFPNSTPMHVNKKKQN